MEKEEKNKKELSKKKKSEDKSKKEEKEIKKSKEEKSKKEQTEEESQDLLLEEEIRNPIQRIQQFFSNNSFGPSLNQREFTPIHNLEEELPKQTNKEEFKENLKFDYLIKGEEKKTNYQKQNNFFVPNQTVKNTSPEELLKIKQEDLYRSVDSISSELAFVQKQTKLMYTKPEKIDFNKTPKEHKKSVENSFEKMKENYR